MSTQRTAHRIWPQAAILSTCLLAGIVSHAIWLAGYVAPRSQPLWSSFHWGVQQCHVSLIALWYGLRVASWRGGFAMAFLIVGYTLSMYAWQGGRDWRDQVDAYAAHFWYEVCAPILLVAGTVKHWRKSAHSFSMSDIVGVVSLFALVLAFTNSLSSPNKAFYFVRGLSLYAVTVAVGFATMPSRVRMRVRWGALILTVPATALPPLILGWHSMWILQFPMTSAWLAIFLSASMLLLYHLDARSTVTSHEPKPSLG